MFTDYEDDDYEPVDNRSELEKWNDENNTGQIAGFCQNCGSRIYQSTYSDFCKCGEQDFSY